MAGKGPSYAGVLRRLRAESGLSQRELAGAIGVSQPLVARTEAGARRPEGPAEIAAVARALALGEKQHDELLVLAGYWPSAFMTLGPDDPTLGALARALTDQALPPAVRDEIRRAVDGVMVAVAAALEAGTAVPVEPGRDDRVAAAPRRSGVPVGRRSPAASHDAGGSRGSAGPSVVNVTPSATG